MELETWVKPGFSVIGKLGSTRDGEGFVKKLWAEANSRFGEIAHLAKRGEDGAPAGIWGAMSDFGMNFKPWENNFSEGLYLAGVECEADAAPPEGWTKWTLPGFEYALISADAPNAFEEGIKLLTQSGHNMVAAAQDYTRPANGKSYILYPIRKL